MTYYIIDYPIIYQKYHKSICLTIIIMFCRESNVEIRDLEAKLRQARINKQVIKSISLHPALSTNNHMYYTCLIFVRCLTD